jgi:biopolymer transport protein ExbD
MSMQVGSDGDEDTVMSDINTTPLVDIMLVLLIIFLITSPIVLKTVRVKLPAESNQIYKTTPENINLTVASDGEIFWNQKRVANNDELLEKLKKEAVKVPQPEVHIRGDQESNYEAIGRVIYTAQRAAIQKVGFVLEPPGKG